MGTFPKLPPGTQLQVGTHLATVVDYLGEGGFAHIYQVSIDPQEDDTSVACLKRVIVPDKPGLMNLRKEVEVMKTLRHARHIVKYYDSHAERLENGTYQVLVLMELCPNKSLLDYMNHKIKTKLTEPEILAIMRDIGVAVYEMHRLKLIHRDIKIENVLIDRHHRFKLCDFGSTSAPIMPPKDQQQFQMLSHDILYHTTPQYRAPEMIDLYRGIPIDDRVDIWALGCFLYKLCYYTTPFEASGDIAILHASFQFLQTPQFSGDLKNLIIIMLQENPLFRPNIVQVLQLVAKMSRIDFNEMGIEDFYHSGPYNFQALADYQRHKQQELLKQQQMYFHQQALAQAGGAQAAAPAANSFLSPPTVGGVSKVQDQVASAQHTPAHPASYISATHTPSAPGPVHPHHAPAPHQLAVPGGAQGSSSRPVSRVSTGAGFSSSHTGTSRSKDEKSYEEIEVIDVPDNESSAGLSDKELMENVEERYPSLENIMDTVGAAAVSRRKNSAPKISRSASRNSRTSSQSRPQSRPSSVVQDSNSRKSSTGDKRAPGEYSHKEAWERSHQNSLNDEAEKLANDIFGAPVTQVTSNPMSELTATSPRELPQDTEEIIDDDLDFTMTYPDAPHFDQAIANALQKSPQMLASTPQVASKSQPVPPPPPPASQVPPVPSTQPPSQPQASASSKAPPPPPPQTIPPLQAPQINHSQYVNSASPPQVAQISPTVPKMIPQMPPPKLQVPPQQVSPHSNNPFPFAPQTTPVSTSAPQELPQAPAMPDRPQRSKSQKSSNPWGEYRPPPVSRIKSNPQDVVQSMMNLSMQDDVNLIDFDNPRRSEQSSDLQFMDLEVSKSRGDSAMKVKSKRLSSIPDFDGGVQEEVVDFASDDENPANNSQMNRMNIRRSLKHSRRSGEYKRSDSGAEKSKRRSFFGT
ncbi:hypothetical protein DIRU0_E02256 [Diutina rugosa]